MSVISPDESIHIAVTLTAPAKQPVYVAEKSVEGFVVEELNDSHSSATFDWVAIGFRRGFGPGGAVVEQPVVEQSDENVTSTQFNDTITMPTVQIDDPAPITELIALPTNTVPQVEAPVQEQVQEQEGSSI